MSEAALDNHLHDGHRKRLKEKIVNDTYERMSDHEFLESLLFFAIPRKDTNELAHRLLNEFGTLTNVLLASFERLCSVKGMTENATYFLLTLPKISKRANFSKEKQILFRNSTLGFAKIFAPKIVPEMEEVLYAIFTRENGSLIACKMISHGDVANAKINVKTIVDLAIKLNALNVAIAHNHPNNVCFPSKEDIRATLHLKVALELCGFRLLDHIVFGREGCMSIMRAVDYLSKPIFGDIDNCTVGLELDKMYNNDDVIDLHKLIEEE